MHCLEEGWDDSISASIQSFFNYFEDDENDDENNDKDKKQNQLPFNDKVYIRCYTECFDLASLPPSCNAPKELYNLHHRLVSSYLTDTVLPSLKKKRGDRLLSEIDRRWKNQKIINRWLGKVFSYIDRSYAKQYNVIKIAPKGVELFKELVFNPNAAIVAETFIVAVQCEREGEMGVNPDMLKNCFLLFQSMRVDLEGPLVVAKREFYRGRREKLSISDSTSEYLTKVETILDDEAKAAMEYLNSSCEAKILAVVDDEMLAKAAKSLVDKQGSGCMMMFENDKFEDLSRMFRLFSRIPNGLETMKNKFKQFLTRKCDEILEKRAIQLKRDDGKRGTDDPNFVKNILSLMKKYEILVKNTLANHRIFRNALNTAFVEALNTEVSGYDTAVVISSFCDNLLKIGGEKLSESEIEEYLNSSILLFSYLKNKDIFADVYRKQFAKRLLNERSLSIDLEKTMISKLKVQAGTQLTGKMEGMLCDLAVGDDLRNEFDRRKTSNDDDDDNDEDPANQIIFYVRVLTRGFWPTYPSPDVNFTPPMSSCMEKFHSWYHDRKSMKKLAFITSLGDCVVRATFAPNKTYDIQVSTLQAIALAAFSGGQTYTFLQLSNLLRLDDATLTPILHSLCKSKVIEKQPPSFKSVQPTDKFAAVATFSKNKRRFRIPMAVPMSSSSSTARACYYNAKRVENDRTHTIEATIVRVMKSRKVMNHNELIAEVSKQLLFFKPNVRNIKRCIESLIDREYLERDLNGRGLYNYLA